MMERSGLAEEDMRICVITANVCAWSPEGTAWARIQGAAAPSNRRAALGKADIGVACTVLINWAMATSDGREDTCETLTDACSDEGAQAWLDAPAPSLVQLVLHVPTASKAAEAWQHIVVPALVQKGCLAAVRWFH